MLNSFVTTVQTPLKWMGRLFPQSSNFRPFMSTAVQKPCGYISAGSGLKIIAAPASVQRARSASMSRG